MKPAKKLSPSEGYVVSRLLQYVRPYVIAREMGVKQEVVHVYVMRARDKYGAETTTEMLQMAAKDEG